MFHVKRLASEMVRAPASRRCSTFDVPSKSRSPERQYRAVLPVRDGPRKDFGAGRPLDAAGGRPQPALGAGVASLKTYDKQTAGVPVSRETAPAFRSVVGSVRARPCDLADDLVN